MKPICSVEMDFAFVSALSLLAFVMGNPLLFHGTPINTIDDPEVCQTQACQESAQFLRDAMNVSVDPCDDFYRYGCGGYIDKHPIPEDENSVSALTDLNDEVYRMTAEALRHATSENHPRAITKAAILFQGCIDEGARERQGLNPLKNILNSFGGWPIIDPQWTNTSYEWYKHVAAMRRTLGAEAIISVYVSELTMGSPKYLLSIEMPQFGVEAKHLENQTLERSQEIIAAYRNYIISTAKLLNPSMDESLLAKDADEIIQFETDLVAEPEPLPKSESQRTPWYQELMNVIEFMITKIRVTSKHFRPSAISDVQRITQNENFNWTDFLNLVLEDASQVDEKTEVFAGSLSYLKHAINLAYDTDPRIVANYIGWTLLMKVGRHTTKEFRENESRFMKVTDEYEEKESDAENLEKICLKEIDSVLGFAVGRLYVDKYINEEEIHEVEQLTEDIRSAFEVNFNHNDWMDSATKQKALEKLRAMVYFIGYPPWIKIDSELNDYYHSVPDIKQDEYFESFVRVTRAYEGTNLGKQSQPIHRTTEWPSFGSILEVNAWYAPSRNVMYFPAAIFNLPIYKQATVPALNYAGIGSFIAHEITHGFDNSGHLYDKEGKLVDWWSPETKKKFDAKVQCLKEQYSKIVEPTTNTSLLNVKTLPDDIADNGAARYAFMAYKMRVLQSEEHGVTNRNTKLPGLSATPEQLYFIGYATMECIHRTKRSMKWTLEEDAHSPGEYRIRVPLGNSRAFAEAFNCPLGSPMNPETKCQLW